MTNQNLIYYPCLAMIVLTAIVLMRMFILRVRAVRSGKVDVRYFKTYDYGESNPPIMVQAGRNFSNLFEVPTLFYMVCVFALITKNVDQYMIWAAWFYVFLRYVHSGVHLTINKIGPRMLIYAVSWVVLLYMGLLLAYRISLQVN